MDRTVIFCAFVCSGLIFAHLPFLHASDCNGNAVDDAGDIAAGHSEDCNLNSIPDECEAAPPPYGSLGRLPPASVSSFGVADFDGDGRLDVAVGTARSGGFGVALFLGSGNRQFQEGGNWLPNTRDVEEIVAADLDGDARSDIVLLDAGGIRAFYNQGAGTFSARLTVSPRDDMSAIAAADLNGDGLRDVLAAQLQGNLVTAFLTGGDRTFAPVADRQVPSPSDMEVGDIDGDGNIEVVVGAGDGVSLLESAGDGTFLPLGQVQGIGAHPRWPALGDLDGDGRIDIVLATDSGVAILFGRGGAAFESVPVYKLDPQARRVTALASTDVDSDGDLDLAAGIDGQGASGELIFLLNDGGGSFRFAAMPTIDASPASLQGQDFDGDGDEDLLLVPPARDRVEVLWNDGGFLETTTSFDLTRDQIALSARFEPHASALRDIDGDGDLDIVTMNGEDLVMVVTNPGTGQLVEGERYTLEGANEMISLVSTDLDNDGDFDVAANDEMENNLMVLLNQGNGTFVQTPEIYPVGGQPSFLAAGDLDGDGFQDLVSASRADDTVGIFINRRNATFKPEAALPVGDNPLAVALGDFGGDGRADLAVVSSGSSTLSIFPNQGAGAFGDPVVLEIPTPRYVVAADLEGDGDLDLVTAHEGGSSLRLFLNDGRGAFVPGDAIELGGRPRCVIACELNRDGFPDLVTANEQDDSICLVLSRGEGGYSPSLTYGVGLDPRYALAGDLDGDGDSDVLSANHTSFDFSVFFNEGTGAAPVSYLERICTELDYFKVCEPTGREMGADRTTRFLVPLEGGRIPTLFENVRQHASQREFLAEVFPEVFPSLTDVEYNLLVGRRATRRYYSGEVYRLRWRYGTAYGFDVVVDSSSDPGEILALEEVRAVHDSLKSAFSLSPLVYHPIAPEARRRAAGWLDPGFSIWMAPFRRGDASADGKVNLTDAIALLDRLFRSGPVLPCQQASDANDDGGLDISDAVFLLLHLFMGAPSLREPAGSCGWDFTPGLLECIEFPPCAE